MSKIFDLYNLTEDREDKLWKDAIFVFDTSFLLNLYEFSKIQRKDIYENIFEKIKDRLWIPAHVQYEYLKNREAVISKPITNQLEPLEKDIKVLKKSIVDLNSSIEKNIIKKIESLQERTKKDDKHTYLKSEYFDDYKNVIDALMVNNLKSLDEAKNIEKEILLELNETKENIQNVELNDDVLAFIEKYFEVGREFTFDEVIEITKEGKHRYEFKIPPGYGDYYKKEKKGTQIFGDLIIWKQILEYSKDRKLPIIFLTNDIKKDDWCTVDNRGRIKNPREELIKELYDFSGVELWMYSFESFVLNAKKYLKSKVSKSIVAYLRYRDIQVETMNYLKQNNNFIIDLIINMMLNGHRVEELKRENNLELYKHSIRSHFKWIIDCTNDSTINFDDYTLNDLPTFYFEYCNFYKSVKVYIKTVDTRKEVKENLEEYFSYLENFYCEKGLES